MAKKNEKLEEIHELRQEALKEITTDKGKWVEFLKSSSKNYKCDFNEKLLIYAQKPDATAVLTYDDWQDVFGRQVKRGAKGIAVLDESESRKKYGYKYFFDISDTYEKANAIPVPIWERRETDNQSLINYLKLEYSDSIDENGTLEEAIREAIDLSIKLEYEYIPTLERQEYLLKNIARSAEVTIFERLSLEVPQYDFQGMELLNKEEIEELTVVHHEITSNMLLEMSREIQLNQRKENENERNNIHNNEQWNIDTQPNKQQQSGTSDREVRSDEERLSQESRNSESESEVSTINGGWDTVHAPSGSEQSSIGNDGNADITNESEREHHGRDEERGQPSLGEIDEQHQGESGGSSPSGNRVPLEVKQLSFLNDYISDEEKKEEIKTKIISTLEDEPVENLSEDNIDKAIDKAIDVIIDEAIDKAVEEMAEEYFEEMSLDWVGTSFTYENRKYMVEEVKNNQASLRDVTFQEGTGFPIWRSESLEWTIDKIKIDRELQREELIAQAKNYEIKDESIGIGTPRERYRNNINAIKIVQTCENEKRIATAEEQEILSKYVGWGGLSEAFDQTKWGKEYIELKGILSEEQYNSARASTLTSFYTPPVVIESMYQALENMGLTKGNILEPSCGVGNFIGKMPQTLQNSRVFGVELDEMSGKIAKLLYPKSQIQITGFEKSSLSDNFFDVAIGNVPFGDFKVSDKKYDKLNFQIHDYFFAKSLDKVRPNGVVAFITSQGTLDKSSARFREYMNERAKFLGAIRLPDNTFTSAAGTRVTSDIIFLQKRERQDLSDADWIHIDSNSDGIEMNKYFVNNPQMVLGKMEMESGPFGMQANCKAFEGANLETQLAEAIINIQGKIENLSFNVDDNQIISIPADPSVKNHSYTVVDNELYYRNNSEMVKTNLPKATIERIKGMVEIRNVMSELIDYQLEERMHEEIIEKQRDLNDVYDKFVKKHGYLSLKANEKAFSEDSSYYLISSLEIQDKEDETLFHKTPMFTKRTIKPQKVATKVDTAIESLALSMAEKAKVDIEYMAQLTSKTEEEIVSDLKGRIFLVPSHSKEDIYQTEDEYLSGNIREKIMWAEHFAKTDDRFNENVTALESVLPEIVPASDIDVRIGAPWIEEHYYKDFIFETLNSPNFARQYIDVNYFPTTGEWKVTNNTFDSSNIYANQTYGTKRMNAYKIFEQSLNLRDVQIFDTEYDIDDKPKRVLNPKETEIARSKQDSLREKFVDWIFNEPERREYLVQKYNEEFNSLRLREYNGEHLNLLGMSEDITLQSHQKDAVARMLYGGNALLAHVVGAGKTFEMIAAAQESKRLGITNKSLIVVPNHLTEQWATEYMRLYPLANILVATKRDFETKNRKKFTTKIATGDYDAIIIGHSQFEKIPLSIERQEKELRTQMADIVDGIAELKSKQGERLTIKQLEKTKKKLQERLEKLNDQSRRDDVINFEELGVDKLFVDEAHEYKNLFLYTKMTNVGGISQTDAQKSSNLYMKCRYMDEITKGKGIVFATGTPISNSMVEMFTMQRYLQGSRLKQLGLTHFDSWAATFGETVTALELAPEGTGYRAKTRFSRFYNLPELMTTFKEVADIKTSDMLDLATPEAHYHTISVEASEIQKMLVEECSKRADSVRNKQVDSTVDNMLKITNDGRKFALDQRLINYAYPDDPNSKVNACVENVFKIWQEGTVPQSDDDPSNKTQLIFSDLSTPKGDGSFNIYNDIRNKLIAKGIPKEEIAFIHDAKTDVQKDVLFDNVRKGKIRVLMGSTAKMGAGTNVQLRLVAIHHIDCPWRPADFEQREGRIIRQGNLNKNVHIYRYVTKGTFDAYLYQTVENKQKYIAQIMTSKAIARSADDVDGSALSYAEIKMLATDNPHIKEKMDLDIKVAKLRNLKNNHKNEIYSLQDFISSGYQKEYDTYADVYKNIGKDIENLKLQSSDFALTIGDVPYIDKEEGGKALMMFARKTSHVAKNNDIGSYKGFVVQSEYAPFFNKHEITLKGNHRYYFDLGKSATGNIQRLENAISNIEPLYEKYGNRLTEIDKKLEVAKIEVKKPFAHQEELETSLARLKEVELLINIAVSKDDYSAEQKEEIEAGIKSGVDTIIYSDMSFSAEQMREIRVGLENGIDVGTYAHPEHKADFMQSIREALQNKLAMQKSKAWGIS